MDQNSDSEGIDSFDWDTEHDTGTKDSPFLYRSSLTNFRQDAISGFGEASSSTNLSNSKMISHFVGMGFPEKMVLKAMKENEGNTDAILETLLTYSALENSAPQECQSFHSDICSSECEGDFPDELSDVDSWPESEEENPTPLSEKEQKLLHLVDMGYSVEEASIAMERCGPDSSIMELTDFICAAQMAKEADAHLEEVYHEDESGPSDFCRNPPGLKKRKIFGYERWERKKQRIYEKKPTEEDDDTIRLPNPMIGFGVPSETWHKVQRKLPEAAIGPPYFYYENVALAPKGVWNTISRFLYDVEPEFVDSKYFCATARKRGYVHNLPIQNRCPLMPVPPLTIHEALPLTRKWWPSWDRRTKLNCLQTCVASAKLTDRIRKALEDWDDEPPMKVQKYVLEECRKWNLVWVGRNKVAPLEPDELEMLLGFPKNHTRGGGISRTERYKALGNSFQVDTVGYHLSVLKNLFPGGINLLSLFSGIGGAEVALHRLGIPLKNVVSVEISETNRNILRSWWEQTSQTGNLVDITDVQELNVDRLEQLISSFGGFDLVVGGSPCNNLTGSNRVTRDGLEGKDSALFYDYFRILDLVKCIMGKNQ